MEGQSLDLDGVGHVRLGAGHGDRIDPRRRIGDDVGAGYRHGAYRSRGEGARRALAAEIAAFHVTPGDDVGRVEGGADLGPTGLGHDPHAQRQQPERDAEDLSHPDSFVPAGWTGNAGSDTLCQPHLKED